MAVRQLAARALAPLVPPEELRPMLLGLLTHAVRSRGAQGSSLNVVSLLPTLYDINVLPPAQRDCCIVSMKP